MLAQPGLNWLHTCSHTDTNTDTHTFRFGWLTRGLAMVEKTNSLGRQIDSAWMCGWDERAERKKRREIARTDNATEREREERQMCWGIDAIIVLFHLYQKPAVAVIEQGWEWRMVSFSPAYIHYTDFRQRLFPENREACPCRGHALLQ